MADLRLRAQSSLPAVFAVSCSCEFLRVHAAATVHPTLDAFPYQK